MTGSKIDLGKMSFFEPAFGAPVQGTINFAVDINANSELSKDGTGSIKLNWQEFGLRSWKYPSTGRWICFLIERAQDGFR